MLVGGPCEAEVWAVPQRPDIRLVRRHGLRVGVATVVVVGGLG